MATLALDRDGIEAELSGAGGRIQALRWQQENAEAVPLLSPKEGCGAFPLVPFGNRLEGNAFTFRGRDHRFRPNTADPFYLHGEGWLGEWQVGKTGPAEAEMHYPCDLGPFRFAAVQTVRLVDGAFELTLAVINQGAEPMPFGLGWHPFFPRMSGTRLQAGIGAFRTERPGHLPGMAAPLPDDLDFAAPGALPERWVNNGLEDWDGRARIFWPERGAGVELLADPVFAHAFLFLPDHAFAPAGDWFCFEPMTHRAGAHHQADLGGLAVLDPGARLEGRLRLTPFALPEGVQHP